MNCRIKILLCVAACGLATNHRAFGQQRLGVNLLSTAAERRAEEALHANLAEKVAVDFSDSPLHEVAEWLKSNDIPAHFDFRALDNFGISTDSPVTFRQTGVTIRAALRIILRELDLTWHVRHEVLMITTPEVSESQLNTYAYPVVDLLTLETVKGPDGTPQQGYDFAKLVGLIRSTIAPDTWDEVGGPGAIEGITLRGVPLLVVSQTHDIQEQLETILTNLKMLASTGAGDASSVRRPPPRPATRGSQLKRKRPARRATPDDVLGSGS